ncbi:hypothetical protein BSKO_06304 [Bryopsis sp. KO-2023]|nr:hypothetical protein BSKO_06304 [Bryopsis sp. KO-2023]
MIDTDFSINSAYTSLASETSPTALVQKGWTYDVEADDFDTRIGRILFGGVNPRGEIVRKTAEEGRGIVRSKTEGVTSAADNRSSTTPKASTSCSDVNIVVVDEQGRLVNRPHKRSYSPKSRSESKSALHCKDDAGLGRSMRLWSRIVPSYLPQCHASPLSTAHSNFQWHPELIDGKSDRHHLKKTDFSEYNEVSLRLMKHLK